MDIGNRQMSAEADKKHRSVRLLGAIMMGTLLVAVLAACDAGGGNPTPTPVPGNTTPTVQPSPTQPATPISTPVSVDPTQHPADFSVTYNWRAGSMPPPFHYEYTVTIGSDGEGRIEYTPDYPSDKVPTWTETFFVSKAQMDDLYSEVVKRNLLRILWIEGERLVGGATEWAEIKSNGTEHKIPTFLQAGDQASVQDFYATVKGLVPQETWDKLEAQRQTYVQEYQQTHK